MSEIAPRWVLVSLLLAVASACSGGDAPTGKAADAGVLPAAFAWKTGPPVLHPTPAGGEIWHSVKDPSVVRHEGRWHLFVTVRGTSRSHAIVYLSFADWSGPDKAERHVLSCHEGYFCAPQVFYFTPHKKWYLICQASDEAWEPAYQPAFATTENIADPKSWSKLTPLYGYKPANLRGWIDFWVICDETKAHLFYTSNDGRMWRSETPIGSFPMGWSEPVLALEADIFEASHTYRLKGKNQYLTLIESENGHGWRYYKAYVADRLDGDWRRSRRRRTRRSRRFGTSSRRRSGGPTRSATGSYCGRAATSGSRSIRESCGSSTKGSPMMSDAERITGVFRGSWGCWSRRPPVTGSDA